MSSAETESMLAAILLATNNLVELGEALIGANVNEGSVGNVKLKAKVQAATTANITLNDEQTIDGVAVVADDRVLVKNQTAPAENGVYTVVAAGDWVRTPDADTWVKLYGALVLVEAGGATNGGNGFLCTSSYAGGVLNTTDLTFQEIF